MGILSDFLGPKNDTVHILLKRRGKTVAAIYKDDAREVRSPNLKKDKPTDESPDRNS